MKIITTGQIFLSNYKLQGFLNNQKPQMAPLQGAAINNCDE
jgi:hypothetical protein